VSLFWIFSVQIELQDDDRSVKLEFEKRITSDWSWGIINWMLSSVHQNDFEKMWTDVVTTCGFTEGDNI
jgi:hypothetical protein